MCGSPYNDSNHFLQYHSQPLSELKPPQFLNLLQKHLIFPNIEIDFGQLPEFENKDKTLIKKQKTLNLVFCPIDCDFQMKV